MILTINEKNMLRFLAVSIKEHSINEIAEKCGLVPNGAYKILKKFEQEGIIKPKRIANIISYKLDFNNAKTSRVLELAFIPELEGRVKNRADDLLPLKEMTKICVVFGSYITSKKEPNDLDLLFVLEKDKFENYKIVLSKVKDITPIKIQDVIQTTEDLKQNIKKEDQIVITALKKGIVLWGFGEIVEILKNVN